MIRAISSSALALLVLAAVVGSPRQAHAQAQIAQVPGTANLSPQPFLPPQLPENSPEPETNVSLIDNAIPMSAYVLRYDAASGINRPTRAEYLFAKPRALGGRGPLVPEDRISFQDLQQNLEVMAVPGIASGFVEVPFRWVNPQSNSDEYGF